TAPASPVLLLWLILSLFLLFLFVTNCLSSFRPSFAPALQLSLCVGLLALRAFCPFGTVQGTARQRYNLFFNHTTKKLVIYCIR
ncbi:MAG: hypothetical protein IKQ52_05910, partial [Bacteroidales bacterium]|nr:hypothetical protein [Bacteroidales bacterium]